MNPFTSEVEEALFEEFLNLDKFARAPFYIKVGKMLGFADEKEQKQAGKIWTNDYAKRRYGEANRNKAYYTITALRASTEDFVEGTTQMTRKFIEGKEYVDTCGGRHEEGTYFNRFGAPIAPYGAHIRAHYVLLKGNKLAFPHVLSQNQMKLLIQEMGGKINDYHFNDNWNKPKREGWVSGIMSPRHTKTCDTLGHTIVRLDRKPMRAAPDYMEAVKAVRDGA